MNVFIMAAAMPVAYSPVLSAEIIKINYATVTAAAALRGGGIIR